jgi:hypothetical protein
VTYVSWQSAVGDKCRGVLSSQAARRLVKHDEPLCVSNAEGEAAEVKKTDAELAVCFELAVASTAAVENIASARRGEQHLCRKRHRANRGRRHAPVRLLIAQETADVRHAAASNQSDLPRRPNGISCAAILTHGPPLIFRGPCAPCRLASRVRYLGREHQRAQRSDAGAYGELSLMRKLTNRTYSSPLSIPSLVNASRRRELRT